jgi:hypothetical protein
MSRRYRRSSTDRYSCVRNATSFEECVKAARAINARVKRDRDTASSAAREAHLRSLMGLSPTRSLIDDRGRT